MMKWTLILIFFLPGCPNGKEKDISNNQNNNRASTSKLDYLYIRLSGKTYSYKPGEYKRNKTVAFFVDKENDVSQDALVDSILNEHNVLAKDSGELKTATLIYSNRLPIDRLINQENKNDKNGFQICFIDIDSMCIRKVVSLGSVRQILQYKEVIGKTIIENF